MMDARSQRLWQRGMSHFQQGNAAAAQAAFEAMLARDPDSGPALYRLSLLQASQGRYVQAAQLAERAYAQQPDRLELLVHLARCRLMCGRTEAARDLATRALGMPREDAVLIDALGVVLTRLDEQSMAVELFDQAIAMRPGVASLHYNRALALRQFDQEEAAERDLERCIELNPAHGKAHWTLASLRARSAGEDHVDRLRAQLAQTPPGSAQEELFSLSVFKELDDLGRYAEAAEALERGIGSRRERWAQSGVEPRAATDAILRVCNEDFPVPPLLRVETAPLFIVGMPGSGVGLVGKLLARHPRIHHLGLMRPFARLMSEAIGRDSTAPFNAPAFRAAARLDFERLGAEWRAAVSPPAGAPLVLCESRPMNFQLAAFIARALPGARFLHVTRDPVDNCVSVLARPGGEASLPSHDPGRLASSYLDYRRLMLHWDRQLPGRMFEVSYESLVEKPETVLRVLCGFLGIRYGSAMRTGLQLHSRSIGRGARYLDRLPALRALA
jgi:tetratricopeptide (TPR) repeat protein